jgi:HD-like signal output (HDOD) protein
MDNMADNLPKPLVAPWRDLPQELRERWLQTLSEVPIPPSLMDQQVVGQIGRTSEPKELAVKLSRDPLLAGKLLAVANSASLGLASPVTSLERAIIQLGTNLVQSLVLAYQLELTLKRWPGYPREYMEYVRAWGAGAAVLAFHFAAAARLPDPPTVSTAALLARLGSMLYGMARPKPGPEYIQSPSEIARLELEERTWGVTHPVLSEQLVRQWSLPDSLAEMLARCGEPLYQECADLPAERGLGVIAVASALAAGYIAQKKLDPRAFLDRPPKAMLKQNLKQMKLLEPCIATWAVPRVQRELAVAVE